MNSEKVKEIKKVLDQNAKTCLLYDFEKNTDCKVFQCKYILDYINELESENERLSNALEYNVTAYEDGFQDGASLKGRIENKWVKENQQLRIANKLYAVELGKKDKKEYENLITNIRLETLKDFREKYKEALKEAVKGENVNCFVESLKIFDKTIEEKICDLK